MMIETTEKPRILIVEDEFLVRLTLAEALLDEGYEVTEAGTGDEAMDLLRTSAPFDLLLTDIQLPGKLDGIGLVELARQSQPGLPAIFVTGRPDTMFGAQSSANDAFIAKPYLPSEITAEVRRLTAAK